METKNSLSACRPVPRVHLFGQVSVLLLSLRTHEVCRELETRRIRRYTYHRRRRHRRCRRRCRRMCRLSSSLQSQSYLHDDGNKAQVGTPSTSTSTSGNKSSNASKQHEDFGNWLVEPTTQFPQAIKVVAPVDLKKKSKKVYATARPAAAFASLHENCSPLPPANITPSCSL